MAYYLKVLIDDDQFSKIVALPYLKSITFPFHKTEPIQFKPAIFNSLCLHLISNVISNVCVSRCCGMIIECLASRWLHSRKKITDWFGIDAKREEKVLKETD